MSETYERTRKRAEKGSGNNNMTIRRTRSRLERKKNDKEWKRRKTVKKEE